uniref:Uncharacterized protein n=1 Tax=Arundo donax TaxID=35708 RepID=A0A0A9AYR7_ARUDO
MACGSLVLQVKFLVLNHIASNCLVNWPHGVKSKLPQTTGTGPKSVHLTTGTFLIRLLFPCPEGANRDPTFS